MSPDLGSDLAAAAGRGGEMGQRFAGFDWRPHPLGAPAGWSAPTRSVVAMALASRFPVALWLGPQFHLMYNDAYIPMLGDKHPTALGAPGNVVWAEHWNPIRAVLEGVVESGVATWSDDLLLPLRQNVGGVQDRYFTFSSGPILADAGRVDGVCCAVRETTERVVGERRLETLNALGGRLMDASSMAEVVKAAVEVAEAHPDDLPMLALYLDSPGPAEGDRWLAGATQNVATLLRQEAPSASAWGWERGSGQVAALVDDVAVRVPDLAAALGASSPQQALVLEAGDAQRPSGGGSLVLGLNPRRPLDESYRGFCQRVAGQVGAAITGMVAYERERDRAEALAQLDRAKTAFLANVSHEFRTPLTLMLGPLEDVLDQGVRAGEPAEPLAMVHRNAKRLLRLVNSLLDFARIEAGQVQPRLVATDVARMTSEIVSSFADICARAGISLLVHATPATARVDAEMWETVVLNLVSNAFKFTLAGSIVVDVRPLAGAVEVSVTDTGVGIAPEDIDRVFERFYRPPGTRGRTAEGTGIGLALVRSLVEAQGGTISLASQLGVGTTLTIRLPLARAPSPQADLAAATVSDLSHAYVMEAAEWIAEQTGAPAAGEGGRQAILIADDNADMRRHLERVLAPRFTVRSVANGEAALESLRRERPELVLTDVMMPGLDGMGLVAAIRSDPDLADLPMVMLSSRAGVEAADEGLAAGADDYIIKPFRSGDLLARVSARLEVARRSTHDPEEDNARFDWANTLAAMGTPVAGAPSIEAALRLLAESPAASLGAAGIAVGVIDLVGALRVAQVVIAKSADVDVPLVISLAADHPMADAIRTGLPAVTGGVGTQAGPGQASRVAVPLRSSSGLTLGCLMFSWAGPQGGRADRVDRVETLAGMMAGLLERLQAAEFEHAIATQLQDQLLKVNLRSEAAAVSAWYEPASEKMRVGGDWYTAISLGPHRIGLSVGDVVGHGLEAAATMSDLRSALNAAALTAEDPGAVVDVIDRYAETIPGAAYTTLAYAVLDSEQGTVTYCRAGHPYPLLVGSDGMARFLEDGARPPINAHSVGSQEASATAPAPPGTLLLLFTDGLFERRGESVAVGLERVSQIASTLAAAPVGEVCAHLIDAMCPPGGYRDDVAIVAARPSGPTETSFVDILPATWEEVVEARQRLRTWLRTLPLDSSAAHDVLLAMGEAINNAVEHGCGLDPDQRVWVEVFWRGDTLTATVSDRGHWEPKADAPAPSDERGRGLLLIKGLAQAVSTHRGPRGTRVTMVFSHPRPGGRY